jgi:hypothetical protein
LYKNLINAGTSSTAEPALNERIRSFNLSLLIGICFVLVNTLFVFAQNLPYTLLLNGIYLFVLIGCYFLNRLGFYGWAFNIGLLSTNVLIFFTCYVDGRFAGDYIMYIPLMALLPFLVRVKHSVIQIVFFCLVILVALYLSLTICPAKSTLQQINDEQYFTLYKSNILQAILLTAAFSIFMFRIYIRNEKKLEEEKEYINLLFNSSTEAVFILDK